MKFLEKMSYGNIESRKKAGIYPLRRKYSFGKTTVGGLNRPLLPVFLGLINYL